MRQNESNSSQVMVGSPRGKPNRKQARKQPFIVKQVINKRQLTLQTAQILMGRATALFVFFLQ